MKNDELICCICGWTGGSEDLTHKKLAGIDLILIGYGVISICPNCGSDDLEEKDFDPYLKNDDEDNDHDQLV